MDKYVTRSRRAAPSPPPGQPAPPSPPPPTQAVQAPPPHPTQAVQAPPPHPAQAPPPARLEKKTVTVKYRNKDEQVQMRFDYKNLKTTEVLLQALARRADATGLGDPGRVKQIGTGANWPGLDAARARLKKHDAALLARLTIGSAVTATAPTGAKPAPKPSGKRASRAAAVAAALDSDWVGVYADESDSSDEDELMRIAAARVPVKLSLPDQPAVARKRTRAELEADPVEDGISLDGLSDLLDPEPDADPTAVLPDADPAAVDISEEPDEAPEYYEVDGRRVKHATLARHMNAHPWIEKTAQGLRCMWCRPKKKSETALRFADTPFTTFKKLPDSIHEHERTERHKHGKARKETAGVIEDLVRAGGELTAGSISKIVESIFHETRHQRPLTAVTENLEHYARSLKDNELLQWLDQSVTYTSRESVLELLHCIDAVLRAEMEEELRAARWWSLVSDGTDDLSRYHKLVTVVRMCAANGKISTRFYELSSMVDRTGWGHAAAIMQDLNVTPTDVNMDDPSQPPPPTSTDADEKARVATEELLSRFVGLALDGTASMSSDSLGAQAALRTHMNAGAVFAWCAAHLLSLATVGAVEGAGVHAVFPRVFSAEVALGVLPRQLVAPRGDLAVV